VKSNELAYIAGFLDGDGCIMLQLIKRGDYALGYQIRASIVFYQKQLNCQFLVWLKKRLRYGYLRNRNDGMTELTIVGVKPVTKVLSLLSPYLVLKRKQAKLALKVLGQMPGSGRQVTPQLLERLSGQVDKFAWLNYSKRRTNTASKVRSFLWSRHLL